MKYNQHENEQGLTLIELLVAVTISVMIMAAIGVVFVEYFRSADQTARKLTESPNLQIAASYYVFDAQSNDPALAPQTCLRAGETALVSFRWHDPGTLANYATDDRNMVVSYVTEVSGGKATNVVRNACVGAVGAADQVGSPKSVSVVKVMNPNPAQTTATTVNGVPQIKVSMCTPNPAGTACKDPASAYDFILSGTRRQ